MAEQHPTHPPTTVPTQEVPGEAKKEKEKKPKIVEVSRNDDIIDEFDFSYIPDSLKDLICGPETAAAADDDDLGDAQSVSKKHRFKKGSPGKEDHNEDLEYDDEYDEDATEEETIEDEESSNSDLTESDEFADHDDDDDDSGESDDEAKRRRRFLIGTHSFLELDDPGLSNALLPKEIIPEKVRRGKKLEKQKYLDLCKEMGIQPLKKFMKNMNKERMDLSRYQLSPDEIIAICKMMENNTKVKYLDLSGNMGGLEGGEAIAKMTENNYTITHLNISSTDIASAFKKICDAIGLNVTLEFLDLSRNNLGDKEMKCIAHVLKETTTLQELYLSRNHIRDVGASYIGQGLQNNHSLMVLDLAINEIKGLKRSMPLFQGIANHPALVRVDLMNNSLKDSMAKGVWRILANNQQLENINISFNLFDNPGAKTIANGFRKSPAMKEFVVGPNEWVQQGAVNILSPLTNPKNEVPLEIIDFGWLFDVYNHFLKVEEKVMKLRPELKIIRGHSFAQWKAKGPDVKALVIRRAKVVCENFATPLEMLIDELRTEEKKNMTHKEFKKFIKSCNLYKDKSLTEAFIKVFPIGSFEVDGEAIIAAYDKEYPKKLEIVKTDGELEGVAHSVHEMRREKDKSIQLMKW